MVKALTSLAIFAAAFLFLYGNITEAESEPALDNNAGQSEEHEHSDMVFQYSTLDALIVGIYDGTMTYGELGEFGDFGLGTFNGLDGEMLAIDGVFYRLDYDGNASVAPDSLLTPFVSIKFFSPDMSLILPMGMDYKQTKVYIDSKLGSRNLIYAFRLEGSFKSVKARSVKKADKPYPSLSEVLAHQSIFDFENIEGTLVGFKMPAFMEGVTVKGYHLHFITADKTKGGHALDFTTDKVTAYIDSSRDFQVALPNTKEFDAAALGTKSKFNLDIN